MKINLKEWKAYELVMAVYILAVLTGLPLAVRDAYYDINIAKYYYYCGTCVLLIPAVIFRLSGKPSVKEFFKSLTLAEKALLVYWIISGLSTLFSRYRFEAFWGNEGRFCGFFLMTIYVIAYFCITRCYKPAPICIYAGMLVACAVFVFAVTDVLNMDIFGFKKDMIAEQIPRFMSTIGNINFYTSYAGMIAAVAAAIYTTWTGKKGAAVWFVFMMFSFVGLIVGNSDNAYLTMGVLLAFLPLYLFRTRLGIRRYFMMVSALLMSFLAYKICCIRYSDIVLYPQGLHGMIVRWDGFFWLCLLFWAATAVIYLLHYKFYREKNSAGRKIQMLWGIVLILAAGVVAAILIDANLLGHGSRYGSLQQFVVFNDDWGTHRGFAWRKAVENYIKFPLLQKILGHGPDTFGIISYFRDLPESSAMYGELFDSVHNEYLQFFVTIGPIATAAYIMFLALSVRDMLRCSCSPYIVGMAFAVACYSVQAVVNINQPFSTPFLWTFLAMGIAECRRNPCSGKNPSIWSADGLLQPGKTQKDREGKD